MAEMKLQTLPVSSILANFYQPRLKFDQEKIKELSESILGNGLINPITVTIDKKRKGKYMIVSGERRWQAHRVGNIKEIPCFVKEYDSQGQFMIESLIENIHREDLSDVEKEKFLNEIMKEEKISEYKKLAERIGGISAKTIGSLFDVANIRRDVGPTLSKKVSQSVIQETAGLPLEQRKELIKKAAQEDFGSREMRKRVVEIKEKDKLEPMILEETINDIALRIDQRYIAQGEDIKLLISNINPKDLRKKLADQTMTGAGLHMEDYMKLINFLKERGAKPNPLITALLKAKNGKS